jgi:prolipoprotein diacylglyceryltransferase
MSTAILASLPRTHVRVLGTPRSTWSTVAALGFVFGIAVAVTLGLSHGLSVPDVAAVAAANLVICAGLTWASARRYTVARLSLLVYAIPLGAGTALTAELVDAGVRHVVDCWVSGVALLLGIGRCGCLMAGCCRGRPAQWGVRYGDRGVAHIPVQAIEAVLLLSISASATTFVLANRPPGHATVVALLAYGIGRFVIECWRNQTPRIGPLTRSQWLSIALLLTAAALVPGAL